MNFTVPSVNSARGALARRDALWQRGNVTGAGPWSLAYAAWGPYGSVAAHSPLRRNSRQAPQGQAERRFWRRPARLWLAECISGCMHLERCLSFLGVAAVVGGCGDPQGRDAWAPCRAPGAVCLSLCLSPLHRASLQLQATVDAARGDCIPWRNGSWAPAPHPCWSLQRCRPCGRGPGVALGC